MCSLHKLSSYLWVLFRISFALNESSQWKLLTHLWFSFSHSQQSKTSNLIVFNTGLLIFNCLFDKSYICPILFFRKNIVLIFQEPGSLSELLCCGCKVRLTLSWSVISESLTLHLSIRFNNCSLMNQESSLHDMILVLLCLLETQERYL